MRLQAGIFGARHYGTQKDGFEVATVIGEVTMRLAKGGDDLRHLKTEHPVRVSERGPVTVRVSLVPFGGMRPDLDTLPRKRGPIARAASGARHPEAAATDPIHARRAREVVVGPALHRAGRREALRTGGQKQAGNPGHYNRAAGGEEATAAEQDGGPVDSSYRE